jgi:hypothetical protein
MLAAADGNTKGETDDPDGNDVDVWRSVVRAGADESLRNSVNRPGIALRVL